MMSKQKKNTSQKKRNRIIATGKACVPTYKIYKKEEFGKMLLQDNRDKNGNKSKNSSNRDPETMKNVNIVVVLVLSCVFICLCLDSARNERQSDQNKILNFSYSPCTDKKNWNGKNKQTNKIKQANTWTVNLTFSSEYFNEFQEKNK